MNRLEEDNQRLQLESIKSLRSFKKSQTLGQVTAALQDLRRRPSEQELMELSRRVIRKQLQEVDTFSKFVNKPHRSAKLHQMRLALKQLRYAMEVFDLLYDGRLKKFIDHCAQLQTHLGDMHDCDLWLGNKSLKMLTRTIMDLKKRSYQNFRKAWKKGNKKKTWRALSHRLAGR